MTSAKKESVECLDALKHFADAIIDDLFDYYMHELKAKNSLLRQRGHTFDKKEAAKVTLYLEVNRNRLNTTYLAQKRLLKKAVQECAGWETKCAWLQAQITQLRTQQSTESGETQQALDSSLDVSEPSVVEFFEWTPPTKRRVEAEFAQCHTETVAQKIRYWEQYSNRNHARNLLGSLNAVE